MTDLIVVLDPNYGDRIETVAETAPVWAVASLVNKTACERIWAYHRTVDHRERGAVTSYDVTDQEDRLGNLLSVLPTLEEHHGEIHDAHFSFPNGFVLAVFGLAPTESVTSRLKDLDAPGSSDSRMASKPPSSQGSGATCDRSFQAKRQRHFRNGTLGYSDRPLQFFTKAF
jgi:hypothetical protein